MNRRSSLSFLSVLSLLALISAAPSLADAQVAERPFFVGGGAGVAIELDRYPTQGKVIEELGWHVLGTTDGPFIALTLGQSFGNDVFTFQATPRFGWDIALVRGEVSVLLAPSVAVGFGLVHVTVNTGFGSRSATEGMFNLQGALDLRILLLDDQLGLFVRPLAIDVFIHDNGAGVRYDALAGAAYHF